MKVEVFLDNIILFIRHNIICRLGKKSCEEDNGYSGRHISCSIQAKILCCLLIMRLLRTTQDSGTVAEIIGLSIIGDKKLQFFDAGFTTGNRIYNRLN